MSLNRAQKEELAKELAEKFKKANVTIFTDYKGISSSDVDQFRRVLRDKDVEVKVLKNNIARKAFEGDEFSDEGRTLMKGLVGPTLVAFANGDPAAAAKAVHEFSKDHEALELKESLMGDSKISPEEVIALAKLPSREALLGQLLSVMNGPARGFVSVLAAVPRSFVTVLSAIQDKKAE